MLSFACGEGNVFPDRSGPTRQGWVPVYVDSGETMDLRSIGLGNGNSLNNQVFYDYRDSSRFVVVDAYRYRLDSLKGIFVQETAEGEFSSSYVNYYKVPGIRTISEEDGRLLVDNFSDQVLLDVFDAPNLNFVRRRTDAALPFIFPDEKPERANSQDGLRYFQCYDVTQGILIGWRHEYGRDLECFLLPE